MPIVIFQLHQNVCKFLSQKSKSRPVLFTADKKKKNLVGVLASYLREIFSKYKLNFCTLSRITLFVLR